jgi:serine/threonine-protein kinase
LGQSGPGPEARLTALDERRFLGEDRGSVEIRPGAVFEGRYRVEGILGEGGMGRVYLARHLELGGRVALKVLHPERLPGDSTAARERLRREARAASRIRGENVARVMDAGVSAEHGPYLVMEHVEGRSLQAVLAEEGPIDEKRAVGWVLQAAIALAEAHALGIVHRDVKPSNLFLGTRPDGSDVVKVLDFGIAKADALAKGTLTDTESLLGSPKYMSPEQIREARTVDARTDVWSLGVVLYELCTGRLPFEAYTATGVLSRIVTDEPTPMAEVFAGVTPGLEAVVLRMLQKQPEARFASVALAAKALVPFGDEHASALAERVTKVLGAPRIWSDAPVDAAAVERAPRPVPRVGPEDETITAASRTHPGSTPAPAPAAPARRRTGPWLAVGAVMGLGAIGAVAFGRGSPAAPVTAAPTASVPSAPTASVASMASAPSVTALPSASVAPPTVTAPTVATLVPSATAARTATARANVVAPPASVASVTVPKPTATAPDDLDFGPRK